MVISVIDSIEIFNIIVVLGIILGTTLFWTATTMKQIRLPN